MKTQFDGKYRLKIESDVNRFRLEKITYMEKRQIERLRNQAGRPANIGYFENILLDKNSEKSGTVKAGYFCNLIPREILEAFGITAVRLDCGNSALSMIGEEYFTGDICPLSKSSLGSILLENSAARSCGFFIMPSSCGIKMKMGEILDDLKPVFIFQIPSEQNRERYLNVCIKEMKRLVSFIEKTTGLRLKKNNLINAINRENMITSLVRKISGLRINNPEALKITDFYLIIQSFLFGNPDPAEWIEEAGKIPDHIKSSGSGGRFVRPGLILTGAPVIWPNFKILDIIGECGADVVLDTLCTGIMSLYNPVMLNEKSMDDIMTSLANKYIFSSACPCFISQSNRLDRVMDFYQSAKASGVINHTLRLCPYFEIENYRLEKILKTNSIPFLNIRTDYSMEDTEQIRTRIEAFMERKAVL